MRRIAHLLPIGWPGIYNGNFLNLRVTRDLSYWMGTLFPYRS